MDNQNTLPQEQVAAFQNSSANNNNIPNINSQPQQLKRKTSTSAKVLMGLTIFLLCLCITSVVAVFASYYVGGDRLQTYLATVPGVNQVIPLTPKNEIIRAVATQLPSNVLSQNRVDSANIIMDIEFPLDGDDQRILADLKIGSSNEYNTKLNNYDVSRDFVQRATDIVDQTAPMKATYTLGGKISAMAGLLSFDLGEKAIGVDALAVNKGDFFVKIALSDTVKSLIGLTGVDLNSNPTLSDVLSGTQYIDASKEYGENLAKQSKQIEKFVDIIVSQKDPIYQDVNFFSDMVTDGLRNTVLDLETYATISKASGSDTSEYTITIDQEKFQAYRKNLLYSWVDKTLDSNLKERAFRFANFYCRYSAEIMGTELRDKDGNTTTVEDCLVEVKKQYDSAESNEFFTEAKLAENRTKAKKIIDAVNYLEVLDVVVHIDNKTGAISNVSYVLNFPQRMVDAVSNLQKELDPYASPTAVPNQFVVKKFQIKMNQSNTYLNNALQVTKPTKLITLEELQKTLEESQSSY